VAVTTFQPEAVVKGAAVAVVVCLPLALVSDAVIDEHDPSRWAIPLFVGVLLGFALGGFVTARNATDYPYTNAALAALAGFVLIQGVGIVVRLVGGEDIHVVRIVFTGLLAYGCGLTGGVAGASRRTSSS
jgi:hypothetical protein